MLNIKEIALKVGAQGLPIEGTAHKFCMLDFCSKEVLIEFAEALIESYKAELLKEVGEPGTWEFRTYNAETDEVIYHVTQSWLEAKHYDQFPAPLYTSEQVAAAVLKATGPLEERRCEICGYAEHHREHTGCLRKQVFSLKAELREICAAIDDPACDPTLTAVECIKKLKAENESLKRDAERLDFILRKQLIVIQDCDDKYLTYNAQSGKRGPEMDSEAEAIDAAMLSQGEQK